MANVVMKLRSNAISTASTAILMSAAFLREPIFCGISISSTWALVSSRRSSSKLDQSAYARRATTAPLGQRVGDRPEVERGDPQPVARSDRQVLVVQEQAMRSSSVATTRSR